MHHHNTLPGLPGTRKKVCGKGVSSTQTADMVQLACHKADIAVVVKRLRKRFDLGEGADHAKKFYGFFLAVFRNYIRETIIAKKELDAG